MLSVSKGLLQTRLKNMLILAYMSQFAGNALSAIQSFDGDVLESALENANEFADTAAEGVADAIHKFLLEIGINITIPPSLISPITPALPGGPCTGAIPMTNIKVF